MYVCLSHNARREEAAECWVLRFALDMMQGWLAGADDGQRGARQIRNGIVVLETNVKC